MDSCPRRSHAAGSSNMSTQAASQPSQSIFWPSNALRVTLRYYPCRFHKPSRHGHINLVTRGCSNTVPTVSYKYIWFRKSICPSIYMVISNQITSRSRIHYGDISSTHRYISPFHISGKLHTDYIILHTPKTFTLTLSDFDPGYYVGRAIHPIRWQRPLPATCPNSTSTYTLKHTLYRIQLTIDLLPGWYTPI
jgi:hypothetical protein